MTFRGFLKLIFRWAVSFQQRKKEEVAFICVQLWGIDGEVFLNASSSRSFCL